MKIDKATVECGTVSVHFKSLADALSLSHPGHCEADVAQALKDNPTLFEDIPDEVMTRRLEESGAWETLELRDRAANEVRALWMLAGNAKDEGRKTAYL
jgi:hypothetical protein